MPDHSEYAAHLSMPAAAFVISLPPRQQRLVLALADQIAAQPFQIADYRTLDSAGHDLENLFLNTYLFTYWVDHPSREVRIIDIARV